MRNRLLLTLAALFLVSAGFSQIIEKELKPFFKIIASPRINVVLKKGDKESIQVKYDDVAAEKINIEVTNKTLHIYLDGARKLEKEINHPHRGNYRSMYEGVSVTAYVTFVNLEELEIRGEQELTCQDPIETPEFILRAYGENDITLASLKTEYFKAVLYGVNKLRIKGGKVIEQRYKLYGENDINTSAMKSAYISTNIYGEGDLRVYSAKEVRINAFGEPTIQVTGEGKILRRMVVGNATIRRR